MSVKQIRRIMFMFILGLVLLALDIYAKTGLEYPVAYHNDADVIGEFQYYNIKTFYGATCTYTDMGAVDIADEGSSSADTGLEEPYPVAVFVDDVFFDGIRIDIFNDAVALLLIIIACSVLSKYNSLFRLTLILSIINIAILGTLNALPFFLNGMLLCNLALGLGTSYLIATLTTTFFGIRGFIALIQDYCCRDERIWLNTIWFISLILAVLVYLLTWLDLYAMAYFFMTVQIMMYILCGLVLKRADEFLAKNCKA